MRTIDGIDVTCGRHEWLQDPKPCEACGYRGAAAEGVTGPVEVVMLTEEQAARVEVIINGVRVR